MSTQRHSAPNSRVLFRRLLLHLAFSVALLAMSLGGWHVGLQPL